VIGPAIKNAALRVPPLRRLRDQRDAALRQVENLEEQLRQREAERLRAQPPAPPPPAPAPPPAAAPAALDVEAIVSQSVARALAAVRAEYTSLPRFAYHLPLDYDEETLPPRFDPPVWVAGEHLPLPPVAERHGPGVTDAEYLEWGRYEKEIILGYIRDSLPSLDGLAVMDFGCSSGRILRHFHPETGSRGWQLTGVDVSARRIEWMRRNFPREFQVYTGSFLPILPFESNSFDAIYGMSVFTHIKYLWDLWLLELRRVLKPGGLLLQSIHTEHAWDFFVQHNDEPWARDSLGPMIVEHKDIPADFVYYGNLDKNQVFWKKDIAIEFWGRYFSDVKVYPPPERYSYQDWVAAIK
jgi:SAM-dependent methyltransferase